MEIETSWKREGIKEGLEQGHLEIITKQLKRRLGKLDDAAEKRIRKLDAEQLYALCEARLDFANAADLKQWLETH